MPGGIQIFLLTSKQLLRLLLNEKKTHIEAWKEFLRRFSKLILKVVWQFESDKDEVMNKYLWVCTKLAENNFSILRKFSENYTTKDPKFTTWLTVIVRNLCVDEYRQKHGRKRFPRAILKMDENDRKVFILYYWKGYTENQIENILDKNIGTVMESLERIENSLKESRGYGIIFEPPVKTVSYNDEKIIPDLDNEDSVKELEEIIEKKLSDLPDIERLIIRLKFWEDLSVKDISRILRIPSEQKVYAIIRKALETLRVKSKEK